MPTVRRAFSGITGFRDVVTIDFYIYMRRLAENCDKKTKNDSLPQRPAPARSIAESDERAHFLFFCLP